MGTPQEGNGMNKSSFAKHVKQGLAAVFEAVLEKAMIATEYIENAEEYFEEVARLREKVVSLEHQISHYKTEDIPRYEQGLEQARNLEGEKNKLQRRLDEALHETEKDKERLEAHVRNWSKKDKEIARLKKANSELECIMSDYINAVPKCGTCKFAEPYSDEEIKCTDIDSKPLMPVNAFCSSHPSLDSLYVGERKPTIPESELERLVAITPRCATCSLRGEGCQQVRVADWGWCPDEMQTTDIEFCSAHPVIQAAMEGREKCESCSKLKNCPEAEPGGICNNFVPSDEDDGEPPWEDAGPDARWRKS
jgi:regulator of replication initiation timing